MKPLVARALPFVLLLGLFALVPARAAGTYPVISAFSPQVAAPGADITIQGSGFAQSGTCQDLFATKPPTVIFTPLDGSPATQAIPNPQDPSACSDSQVVVPATNFTSAARISIIANPQQPNGSMSNDPGQGIDPLLTAPLRIEPTQLTGMVASSVTITGDNVMPGTAVLGSLVMHLDTGSAPFHCAAPSDCTDLRPTGWSPSGISVNPGQAEGEVTGSFLVAWDRRDPSNPQKQVRETFDGGAYTFSPPSFPARVVVGAGVGLTAVFRGANLGTAPQGTVAFPGSAPVKWKSRASDQFSATIPNGVPPVGNATITLDGWNETYSVPINVTPLIKTGPVTVTGGDHVDIDGTTFGTSPGNMLIGDKYVNAITEWHDTRVTFFVPEDQASGRLQITRPPEVPGLAEGYQVNVVPRLVQLSADDVRVEQEISIDGHSLGQPGTLLVGATRASILLWSLKNIVFRVPSLAPGAYPITVTTSAGKVAGGQTLHVVGGSDGAASPGSPDSTNCRRGASFVKPARSDSPVQVTLEAEKHNATPGARVPVLVTVRLNGQPVQGATIQLTMRCSPGAGYAFTPATGATDKEGRFRAAVRVSDAPGENIIRAESGVFSDEDHVLVSGVGPRPGSMSEIGVVAPVAFLLVLGVVGFAAYRLRRRRR